MNTKKKITIATIILIIAIIFIGVNIKKTPTNIKMKKIESLYSDFTKEPSKQGDILIELIKLKKDEDTKVSSKATEYYDKVLKNANDKSVIDNIKNKSDAIKDSSRQYFIKDLEEIKSDSLYYVEAQDLIKELSATSTETQKSLIEIQYYTKHSTAGSQKLNIKVQNTSGRDIEYLALDILEIDKRGNVINSDWTNTSALILNDASISIDTYFDYQGSESDLEFRIKDIMYK